MRERLGNIVIALLLAALCLAFVPLHDDAWWPASPSPARWTSAALAGLCFVALCGWMLRPRRQRRGDIADGDGAGILIAWASQTGFAERLASQTAEALARVGIAAQVSNLSQISAEVLHRYPSALFIASTTGEGDPPDHASACVRTMLGNVIALPHLRYAVLALGDRKYARFCGFGHRLDAWLRGCGAQPLFDLIEVDNGDAGALRQWQHRLALITGAMERPDWISPVYGNWTLRTRLELNPGSAGDPAFHLALTPPAGDVPQWQAGDIAEIGPRHAPDAVRALLGQLALAADTFVTHGDIAGDGDGQRISLGDLLSRMHLPDPESVRGFDAQALADVLQPLPHREYSIASLPADGQLELLVREMRRADGTPTLGSGWLCRHAPLPGDIALRIRSNRAFHPPDPQRPLILIGNGTGMAGLRAHMKARVIAGARRNWLLFGERNAARDLFFGNDIAAWRADGWLERLDLAFSRDAPQRRYVQAALEDAADALRAWIDAGATILVCGSIEGMAPGVDDVLRQTLGNHRVDALRDAGLYRRDVY